MKNIAIFASGSGTNVERIIKHFMTSDLAKVTLILSNKVDAFVLERAKKASIPSFCFSRDQINKTGEVNKMLIDEKIDYIVLAGFLWLMPADIIEAYRGRIINVHPALLPSYGGKGMYGDNVHRAVVAAREKRSGITVHLVNEHYDSGDILLQAYVNLADGETAESLAAKIHTLEYAYFPVVIEAQIESIFGK